ncbi:MBL fold metallo-hydrolase [Microbacterium sp. RURRCA19A]|uniref:MBL fold metallo-hydrolase n=1 Tax=Microbacterium sp. RURRCA19A TaxID=1907391 RepID=UPI000956AC8A|nr:MBL fold metallo-hydrolase [Microbacterium sp. RURRCA19A]SIR96317.1 Glyoxylase, beta-lactamase superfamily II [Microbacterium sp. RURRCA19A]
MLALHEVAPGVLVATSRVMQTTSTVVVEAGRALLIDPAWMPDELDALVASLRERGLTVAEGFATHAHHDHLLWHPEFGSVPRWASARTAELARLERDALVAALGAGFPAELVELMGRVDAGSPTFDVELVVHDGHAPGHTAVWLPELRVLVAGDMLSDVELPLPFWPDDVPAYERALDVLEPYARSARVVIPGHGNVGTDALARLEADRRYLADMRRVGESTDPRRANPGMAQEYERLRELLA